MRVKLTKTNVIMDSEAFEKYSARFAYASPRQRDPEWAYRRAYFHGYDLPARLARGEYPFDPKDNRWYGSEVINMIKNPPHPTNMTLIEWDEGRS
jgi:hypothetical protein